MWGAHQVVKELYGRQDRIPENDHWEIFDWVKEDICGMEKVCLNMDTIREISNYVKKTNPKSKKIQKMGYYTKFLPENHCCGILGNGDLCGTDMNTFGTKVQIDSQYHKGQIGRASCRERV